MLEALPLRLCPLGIQGGISIVCTGYQTEIRCCLAIVNENLPQTGVIGAYEVEIVWISVGVVLQEETDDGGVA